MTNLITIISLSIIAVFFLYFCWEILKLHKAAKIVIAVSNSENILDSLTSGKLAELANKYRRSITINLNGEDKTTIPASDYFNEISVGREFKFNVRMLDSASGVLVGLGLLGTFLGLTVGIKGFNTSTASDIQASIQGLLDGMGTAFLTSLFGMGLSLLFTVFFDKPGRKKLQRAIINLDKILDDKYYVEDYQLIIHSQQELFQKLANEISIKINEGSKNIVDEIKEGLSYTSDTGEKATISNAIRVILRENEEQTKALKSFSTDLAIELNNGFDEVLSRQMQQRILPLMENVDTTTKAIVEHIDQMALAVSAPATDMLEKIVSELKTSMMNIVDEFKTSLSGSATGELEKLAMSLGTATQTMGEFPQNMAQISSTLQVTIEEVKDAIAEITSSSANANSSAMRQMQEQITMATTSMSVAIEQVKEVMGDMTNTSKVQSEKMMQELTSTVERLGGILEGTVSTVASNIDSSFSKISENVTNSHTELVMLQGETTSKTEKLLETFNAGLDRLERMNAIVAETMNQFQLAQGQISGTTAHLQTITGDMKLATQLFGKSQSDYQDKLSYIQTKSQEGINAVENLLRQSGSLSEEYARKFEIIRQGLGSIFSQLQTGLSEYSRTVQATTQKYLDLYSTSLTNTTDKLSSTISQQNEVVEMLVSALDKNKIK